ncbi:MAG TPA: class I SAM-dependent methyltransferase [Rhodanobacteraceae bacterium]|nr:class I SAM-dependent methyltransferase [Rhodanobacteraceae bacterium]
MNQNHHYLPNVREQYEQYPYPERNPRDEGRRLIVSHRMRLDSINHHCFNGRQDFNNGFRALTAGGGTGDALIACAEQLRNKRDARITYLDMSTASARIAHERAAVRRLQNIDWINDSLLNLPNMGVGPFDFIDCAGVLHHLEDPDAGLKALLSVLKPGGVMSLMVYAPYGRTGVYQLQSLMRMINNENDAATVKIRNAREILRSLPDRHWFNIGQRTLHTYSDLNNDAGIFDLLLHTQDRAFSILEVHDWLERCGMKLAGEPGTYYRQLHYLPETFLKDGALLRKIKQYPLKLQQAIGEALSGEIAKHEFYAVRSGDVDPAARLTDEGMIPWPGIGHISPLDQLAEIAEKRNDAFTVTLDQFPDKPRVSVAKGPFVASLLRTIDGTRTVDQIVTTVAQKHANASRDMIMIDFEKLFAGLNRGHAMFLRHESVAAFTPLHELTKKVY